MRCPGPREDEGDEDAERYHQRGDCGGGLFRDHASGMISTSKPMSTVARAARAEDMKQEQTGDQDGGGHDDPGVATMKNRRTPLVCASGSPRTGPRNARQGQKPPVRFPLPVSRGEGERMIPDLNISGGLGLPVTNARDAVDAARVGRRRSSSRLPLLHRRHRFGAIIDRSHHHVEPGNAWPSE